MKLSRRGLFGKSIRLGGAVAGGWLGGKVPVVPAEPPPVVVETFYPPKPPIDESSSGYDILQQIRREYPMFYGMAGSAYDPYIYDSGYVVSKLGVTDILPYPHDIVIKPRTMAIPRINNILTEPKDAREI